VAWNTDVPATSQVEYGTTTDYGNMTALNTSLVTKRGVDIIGLKRRTVYHFRVRSIAGGIETVSADFTFKTK
jgi:hypothetical protein